MALTKVSRGLLTTSIVDNGNATAITIDSNENVGIGGVASNSSGYTTLNLNNATNGGLLTFQNNGTAKGYIYNSSSQFRIESATSTPLVFANETGETMRISGSNVGIGTSSPAYALDLTGAMRITGSRSTYIDASEDSSAAAHIFTTDALVGDFAQEAGHLVLQARTHTSVYRDIIFAGGINAASDLMRITGEGNVGIGIAPSVKLEVNGGADGSVVFSGRSDGGNGNNQRFNLIAFADGGGSGYGGGLKIQTRSSTNVFSDSITVTSAGSVGIGTSTPSQNLEVRSTTQAVLRIRSDAGSITDMGSDATGTYWRNYSPSSDTFRWNLDDGTEAMRINSAGNLLVGTTSAVNSAKMSVNGNATTFVIHPAVDNNFDCGHPSYRWDDIRATNGTIQTSDRNEKQDIEALSEAEQRVAVAAKGLMRKFRWISSVQENGDNARIHFGIIAQDLQDAFTAEGLDAGRYAMFISDTWWETQTEVAAVEATEDTEAIEAVDAYTRTDTYDTAEEAPEGATERTRLGVRYNELLAFIISAI